MKTSVRGRRLGFGVLVMVLVCIAFRVQASEPQGRWEKARKELTEAVAAVGEAASGTARKTWEKTREKSSRTMEQVEKKSEKVLAQVRGESGELLEAVRKGSRSSWQKLKKTSGSLWHRFREEIHHFTAPEPENTF
ncbi:hypothetical protein [Desulfolithobacter sp.]